MYENLIIEEDTVYEMDAKCLCEKEKKDKEKEEKKEWRNMDSKRD